MSDAKWKDFLLKSGLPFEHLVAEILARRKWYVDGQYSYSRRNETGIHTEFSVDLHGYSEFSSKTHWIATLNLLIECKYSSPGVKWVFSPYPASTTVFSGWLKVFDQMANKRLASYRHLAKIEAEVPYCIRGVSLSGNGCDESIITRGLSQLSYAMPRLAERTFSFNADDRCDEDIAISYAGAILVTSAPIYVLKDRLTLDDVSKAHAIEDISLLCDAVIAWNQDAPDRQQYSDEVFRELTQGNSAITNRLAEYGSVFPKNRSKPYLEVPSLFNLQRAIRGAGDHILVINIDSLESYLKRVRDQVRSSLRSVRTFANVTFDLTSGKTLISRVNGSSGRK